MKNSKDAKKSISTSFDQIITDCRKIFGSELHYQAMIYHILRSTGNVDISQMGMNVKTTIENCRTEFFKKRILKKDIKYQTKDIEIIPDISIYSKSINSDWRRRNYKQTLEKTLYSLEIKASERANSRISFSEIETDILKLEAQYQETLLKYNKKIGVGILIVDVAIDERERMSSETLKKCISLSSKHKVDFWYFNQDVQIERLT